MAPNGEKMYLRCLDRNCKGRLHLEVEASGSYVNPEISTPCTLRFEEHSWIKKEIIQNNMGSKTLSPQDINRRSTQLIYFEKKIKDGGNPNNVELVKEFKKENPDAELKIQSRDMTIVRQNLKRKAIEVNRAKERIDNILTSSGQNFLLEKVII